MILVIGCTTSASDDADITCIKNTATHVAENMPKVKVIPLIVSSEDCSSKKDKPKCGRTPHIPSEIVRKITKKLTESNQDWSTKQVNDMVVKESGIQYHYTHVYRLLHKWGFKQKIPRKVHVNTASEEEKGQFKKEPGNTREFP